MQIQAPGASGEGIQMTGMSALPVYLHGVRLTGAGADTVLTSNVVFYGLHLND